LKEEQDLKAKIAALLEKQLKIWQDFGQLRSKSPDLTTRMAESIVKKFKN
jgi:hypothetical protein